MGLLIQIGVIFIVVVYSAALLFILIYGIAQADLLYGYLFHRKKYKEAQQPAKQLISFPMVTVQLPVYNEKYVVERLIDCIAELDYPKEKLEIQVLDDSTDETVRIVREKVAQKKGFVNISHIHRTDRSGFKAGALKEGLACATGELIVLFDADFLPGKDFLLNTVPHFINEKVGMVQAKWTWLNRSYSLITRAQAFALDAHFSIEQVGRNINQGFINFNGTAGLWRKSCIIDAGNWHSDTLTEDLDLSYRAQLKGWKFIYLEEVNSPSELPPVMSAVKSQQYRWNKGGAETARKHLHSVVRSSKPWHIKWHGVVHLLTSAVFLAVFACSLLSVPVLLIMHFYPGYLPVLSLANDCFAGFLLLGIMYMVTTVAANKNRRKGLVDFLQTMPVFLSLSLGLSFHNAIAVLEGYSGKKTPFVRTPKFNLTGHPDNLPGNRYQEKGFDQLILAEAGLGIYFAAGIFLAFRLNNFALLPFHILLLLGYVAVIYYSLEELAWKQKRRRPGKNIRYKIGTAVQ